MAELIDLRDDVAPDERLFAVTKHFLAHEMGRGCKASGVKRIRVHDMRHSHVSLLIEMGFSALAIAERMVHEAVDTAGVDRESDAWEPALPVLFLVGGHVISICNNKLVKVSAAVGQIGPSKGIADFVSVRKS